VNQEDWGLNLTRLLFVSSMLFLKISEGRLVTCFRKFPKGAGLNHLQKFTCQGTCSHVHYQGLLGIMRCFWNSVVDSDDTVQLTAI
jgi:hypothetical protein